VDSTDHALLFIPGALISHTAYSEVAAKLSDQGVCVVTVSMEPCRMATLHLGANEKRFRRIRRHVNTLLPSKASWSIGGHSLGSFAAMRLARNNYKSLIMWGSANFANTRTNLRDCTDLPVLVVQGSNDALCAMDDASFIDFNSDFPKSKTTYKTIRGAAHSWFASIDGGDPKFLGLSAITMERHQEEAARITANFLKDCVERPEDEPDETPSELSDSLPDEPAQEDTKEGGIE